MISQYDLLLELRNELPQISESLHPERIGSSVYSSLETLTEYTRHCLHGNHLTIARKCFSLAAIFYTQGDPMVKKAIEDIFIDSLCGDLKSDSKEEIVCRAMMPHILLHLYISKKAQNFK